MNTSVVYPITPVPKPRMTRRDRWAKRPCVLRYWAFKDEVRLRRVSLPDRAGWCSCCRCLRPGATIIATR